MQPFKGKICFGRKPKVAPSSQPWADGWNPVGILNKERAGLKWWAEKYMAKISSAKIGAICG
jgi:hypothetical protein